MASAARAVLTVFCILYIAQTEGVECGNWKFQTSDVKVSAESSRQVHVGNSLLLWYKCLAFALSIQKMHMCSIALLEYVLVT